MKLLLLIGCFECGSMVLDLYLVTFSIERDFSLVYNESIVGFLSRRVSSLQMLLTNLKNMMFLALWWPLFID